jgi:bleomycin hydrolase
MFRRGLLLISLFFALCFAGVAPAQTRKELLHTLDKLPHPASEDDFQAVPHLRCLNQGRTMVCWSYATSSFLESEMARMHLPLIHLSVMYPTYCEFLEKTRRFVRTKGDSRFSPGDLFTGVLESCRDYGALPATAYDHTSARQLPDQHLLYGELNKLTTQAKLKKQWDEAKLVPAVQQVLDQHLGQPPATFSFNGHTYTPTSFRDEVVKLPLSDYVMLTSFESAPFDTFTDLKVPDNWRHNSNYFNVPLPVFYDAFKHALQSGFSVAVSMDITEPSYKETGRYCFIPEACPTGDGLTQAAREQQFQSGATTDDHAIHFIGYGNFNGEDWFLAKDSWKTAWQDGNQGCLFVHSSYVKMKILAFIVHRDGLPATLKLPVTSSRSGR